VRPCWEAHAGDGDNNRLAVAVAVDLTSGDAAEEAEEEDRFLTTEESRKVLVPLLRLRQACNHPQAGGSFSKSTRQTMNPLLLLLLLRASV